ncbi:hypothetical protein SAY87_024332 [Trapa incisa]|uniref:Uncharacterized protein n=1 Tax=Trapa incisa TaxID=236973 RepID=A0AAN7GP22_9MYRT|nr:hypothetical protein SAY87_024332 [Trapa incisa]
MKRNPPYKRKWHAPMIHNLNYKGIWKPRDIPNPDYFELEKPDFEPISAVGWKPKFELEKEKHEEEDVVPGSDGLAGLHRIVEEAQTEQEKFPDTSDAISLTNMQGVRTVQQLLVGGQTAVLLSF